MKRIIILSLVMALTMVLGSNAQAAISTIGSEIDTIIHTRATMSWDEASTSSWSYKGTYWDLNVTMTLDGNNWLVDWDFTHLVAPHTGEAAPNSTAHMSSSFADTTYGYVIWDASTWDHSSAEFPLHVDDWNFRIYHDEFNSDNNEIRLIATHMPEPVSSILFITGGTLLAGRRYMRKKKI